MSKVAAPRSNKKATKIAYNIMGLPRNLVLIKKTPKEKKIDQLLAIKTTFNSR